MTMTATPKLLRVGRAALAYAALGWRVFPLHSVHEGACSCGSPACTGTKPGKHPRTPRGCLDATTDEATIHQWWTEWPDANVGIATGRGLVVVDIDPQHGGDVGLEDCVARLGALPDTVECLTGGGGRHIYLSVPAGTEVRNSASKLAPGVDVRGDGGYVVAAPSGHASGRAYTWELSSRPDEVEIAPLPAAWLAALVRPAPKLRVIEGGRVGEGARNEVLFKIACSMRSAGLSTVAILAALQAHNEERCDPPLDPAEVKAIASSVARYPEGLSPEYEAKRAEAEQRRLDAETRPVDLTASAGAWTQDLYTTKDGRIRNTFANICTILRGDTTYASLAWNEMSMMPELDGTPAGDARMGLIRESIERAYGFSPGADALAQAVVTVADASRYHPVRRYLQSLEWDGTPRLSTLARELLGAQSDIECQMVRAWFISAVARVLSPGCKVDTVLVLVGPQGARKSTFFGALAGADWFSDSHVDLGSKDVYLQLGGKWIIEWGEVERIIGRRGTDEVKSFISSRADTFRAPYARAAQTVPRTCVLVGTTNEDSILHDATGSRRFWCVRVRVPRIDSERLSAERDQLWAEAVNGYQHGEQWWLDEDSTGAHEQNAEQFRVSDPWEPAIAQWIASNHAATYQTAYLLQQALGLELKSIGQREQVRAAAILSRLGFERRVERIAGHNTKLWRRKA
jgi:predicted P-loop ATPase